MEPSIAVRTSGKKVQPNLKNVSYTDKMENNSQISVHDLENNDGSEGEFIFVSFYKV